MVCVKLCYGMCHKLCYGMCHKLCYGMCHKLCYGMCHKLCYGMCHKLYKSAVLKTIFQNRKKGCKKNTFVSLSQNLKILYLVVFTIGRQEASFVNLWQNPREDNFQPLVSLPLHRQKSIWFLPR